MELADVKSVARLLLDICETAERSGKATFDTDCDREMVQRQDVARILKSLCKRLYDPFILPDFDQRKLTASVPLLSPDLHELSSWFESLGSKTEKTLETRICERFYSVLFYKMKNLCDQYTDNGLQTFAGMIPRQGELGQVSIKEHLETYIENGEKYISLSHDLGGSGTLFLLPDRGESYWLKVPKGATPRGEKTRSLILNSLLETGITSRAIELDANALARRTLEDCLKVFKKALRGDDAYPIYLESNPIYSLQSSSSPIHRHTAYTDLGLVSSQPSSEPSMKGKRPDVRCLEEPNKRRCTGKSNVFEEVQSISTEGRNSLKFGNDTRNGSTQLAPFGAQHPIRPNKGVSQNPLIPSQAQIHSPTHGTYISESPRLPNSQLPGFTRSTCATSGLSMEQFGLRQMNISSDDLNPRPYLTYALAPPSHLYSPQQRELSTGPTNLCVPELSQKMTFDDFNPRPYLTYTPRLPDVANDREVEMSDNSMIQQPCTASATLEGIDLVYDNFNPRPYLTYAPALEPSYLFSGQKADTADSSGFQRPCPVLSDPSDPIQTEMTYNDFNPRPYLTYAPALEPSFDGQNADTADSSKFQRPCTVLSDPTGPIQPEITYNDFNPRPYLTYLPVLHPIRKEERQDSPTSRLNTGQRTAVPDVQDFDNRSRDQRTSLEIVDLYGGDTSCSFARQPLVV